MRTYKPVETEGIDDILCDLCGKSCKRKEVSQYMSIFEHATFSADWGYFSTKDGTHWDADLCEQCSDLVKEFIESKGGKINVKE